MPEELEARLMDLWPALLNLIYALVLLLIGYIVAKLIAALVRKVLHGTTLDNRIANALSRDRAVNTEHIISKAVFWFIFLFVIVAVLQVLNLTFVTEPLNRFLGTVLEYIPQLIAAAVLIFIAYVVATLLRALTRRALDAAGVDRRVNRELAKDKTATEDPTVSRAPAAEPTGTEEAPIPISESIATVVYYLVWLLFLPAILDALELQGILRPVESMLNLILAAIPQIFAAALVLIIAYFVGRLVAGLVSHLLASIGFNRMLARAGLGREVAEAEIRPGRRTPADIVGTLVLVAIMLFAAMEAANLLGFEALTVLIADFLVLFGQIILGLVIFAIGLYLANVAYRAVRDSGIEQTELLAVTARIAIIVLAGAMALRQMGLANSIINLAFGLILGAIAVAAAIAFGLGGREFAQRQLERLAAGSSQPPQALKPSPTAPGMERGPEKALDPRAADAEGDISGRSSPPPSSPPPGPTRRPEE